MEILNIYFDESGFTGQDLLAKDQQYFVFGAVACEEEIACNEINKILQENAIAVSELKGSKLLKTTIGKKIVLAILHKLKENIHAIFFDKKYALSSKIFEYIFEPVLASKSSLFYKNNFHKFIASSLYIHFLNEDEATIELFEKFANSLKSKDFQAIYSILQNDFQNNDLIQIILNFINNNRAIIQNEIESTQDWTLDLSNTAAHSLLCEFGKLNLPINAIFDMSKPLNQNSDFFDNMIGRKDISYMTRDNEKIPITYNLYGSIKFGDSKIYKGIQIADVVAASVAYMLNKNDDFSVELKKILLDRVISNSMFFDENYIDLNQQNPKLNIMTLFHIDRKIRNNMPILDNIEFELFKIHSMAL